MKNENVNRTIIRPPGNSSGKKTESHQTQNWVAKKDVDKRKMADKMCATRPKIIKNCAKCTRKKSRLEFGVGKVLGIAVHCVSLFLKAVRLIIERLYIWKNVSRHIFVNFLSEILQKYVSIRFFRFIVSRLSVLRPLEKRQVTLKWISNLSFYNQEQPFGVVLSKTSANLFAIGVTVDITIGWMFLVFVMLSWGKPRFFLFLVQACYG